MKVDMTFEFPARYAVEVHERMPRPRPARVLSYPDAAPVAPLRALSRGPIVEVTPASGEPWVGLFEGRSDLGVGDLRRPALIGWPDECSLCVVAGGIGTVVRTDDPTQTFEVEAWPVQDFVVLPSRGLVVFADWLALAAYGANGLVWHSGRIVRDDLKIVRVEDDRLLVRGFLGGDSGEFGVDLATGTSEHGPVP